MLFIVIGSRILNIFVNVRAVNLNLSVSKKSIRPFARHRTLKSDFLVSLMFSKV